MKHKLSLFTLTTAFFLLSAAIRASDWRPLFNSRNLDGWTQHGGKAPYTVENGEIVGTTVIGEPNSFLCTARDYDNFVLELEFKVDPKLNSGVQFRSHISDTKTAPKNRDGSPMLDDSGNPRSIAAGRVHGYQCEIDLAPDRARYWTGGVYDESRRLWLFPGPLGGDGAMFTREGETLARQNDWNQLRIEASGTRIRTWVNGRLRADFNDDVDVSGFIALQIHSVPDKPEFKGLQARFRNIRLKSLPSQ